MKIRIFRYIFALSLGALFAQGVYGQSARDYIRRGNRMMADSLVEKGQVQYQKAVQKDNGNSIAHYNLGVSLMMQNKAQEAMKEFEVASKLEKDSLRRSQIYHNMGGILQSSEQYCPALQCYKESLRNDSFSEETRYNYALCLYMLKKNQGNGKQSSQKDEKGEDEKKEKDKNSKEENPKQSQDPERSPSQMSKDNAEQLLNAAIQDEKGTQEKLQKAVQRPNRKNLEKQW